MNKLTHALRPSARAPARPLIQLSGIALSHVRGGADEDPDTTHTASKPAAKLY